ncbi:hypothetical protein ROHU_007285 [Labeo rohita]|uniref:Uncharacterized protein n=1 Tax=Labeo rohita TaxID=84645 RepID=A0A498MDX9_LABRO|nr:hypothetical protein ROHU_007285 [Labeo rohita]
MRSRQCSWFYQGNTKKSGQRRTTDQIKLRWKNLKARATKDHAEAKNPQTGNKPFKRGDYTDVVLDIIGGEKSQALHGIQGVVGDGEPWIEEEEENLPVPPEADPESVFILNLSSVPEEEAGSSLIEPVLVATGSQRKGLKCPSSNKDDDYKALLQKETESAEAQFRLAEEQLTLTKLQQTKARLEIRLLKATLRQASLSTSDEEV